MLSGLCTSCHQCLERSQVGNLNAKNDVERLEAVRCKLHSQQCQENLVYSVQTKESVLIQTTDRVCKLQ